MPLSETRQYYHIDLTMLFPNREAGFAFAIGFLVLVVRDPGAILTLKQILTRDNKRETRNELGSAPRSPFAAGVTIPGSEQEVSTPGGMTHR